MMKVRDILRVACPKCGAAEGSMCKRLTPGRYSHIDGVHKARREAAQAGSSEAVR